MADSEPLETEAEIDPDLRTSSGQAADLPTCDDRPPASLPDRIGRYRIEKVLGQGGFGLVYLAHDDKLDRVGPKNSADR